MTSSIFMSRTENQGVDEHGREALFARGQPANSARLAEGRLRPGREEVVLLERASLHGMRIFVSCEERSAILVLVCICDIDYLGHTPEDVP